MSIVEFLLTDKSLNKSALASLIWPDMESAETHLQAVIEGKQPLSEDDARRAIEVLQQLSTQIRGLTLEGDYPDE